MIKSDFLAGAVTSTHLPQLDLSYIHVFYRKAVWTIAFNRTYTLVVLQAYLIHEDATGQPKHISLGLALINYAPDAFFDDAIANEDGY